MPVEPGHGRVSQGAKMISAAQAAKTIAQMIPL
jgi:hypothetical protein